jgi:hypothetical protein
MPRYRFRWELIPQPLLRRLTRELELAGDPVDALRREYGMRPKEEFIRQVWPVLRENWLTKDPYARSWVVDELREAKLGDYTSVKGTRASQLDYLRSCRNSSRLREAVLVAFLELGDIGNAASPEPTSPGPPSQAPEVPLQGSAPPSDLDRAVEQAWREFQDHLTEQVRSLAPDQVILLEVPTSIVTDDAGGLAAPYVQIIGEDNPRGWFAEASSNHFLDPRLHLDEGQQGRLVSLGWLAPTRAPEDPDEVAGSPNFHLSVAGDDGPPHLARLMTRTVRDVFGVPHPSFLTAGGYGVKDADPPVLDLGIPSMSRQPELNTTEAIVPNDAADLRRLVDAALAPVLGGPPHRDEDGDIPVRAGTAMVFVRVPDDAPVVEIFSPVLLDVDWSPDLLSRLSEINGRIRFGKLSYSHHIVFASMSVFAHPFAPTHLRHALTVMSELADDVDESLQQQFGGRVFFGEHTKDGQGLGGYL